MPVTPGVTDALRMRAAREIGRIELAGLDWCNVAGVVELPLYVAERRRVVEVLSVQDMVALDSPPYAAAGDAVVSARSKASPRATRSRYFIEVPISIPGVNTQSFPSLAL